MCSFRITCVPVCLHPRHQVSSRDILLPYKYHIVQHEITALKTHTQIVDQYSMHFFPYFMYDFFGLGKLWKATAKICRKWRKWQKRKEETFNKPKKERKKNSDALYIHLHCYYRFEIPSHYCCCQHFYSAALYIFFPFEGKEKKGYRYLITVVFLFYFYIYRIKIYTKISAICMRANKP